MGRPGRRRSRRYPCCLEDGPHVKWEISSGRRLVTVLSSVTRSPRYLLLGAIGDSKKAAPESGRLPHGARTPTPGPPSRPSPQETGGHRGSATELDLGRAMCGEAVRAMAPDPLYRALTTGRRRSNPHGRSQFAHISESVVSLRAVEGPQGLVAHESGCLSRGARTRTERTPRQLSEAFWHPRIGGVSKAAGSIRRCSTCLRTRPPHPVYPADR
jgi:hypothetical protein